MPFALVDYDSNIENLKRTILAKKTEITGFAVPLFPLKKNYLKDIGVNFDINNARKLFTDFKEKTGETLTRHFLNYLGLYGSGLFYLPINEFAEVPKTWDDFINDVKTLAEKIEGITQIQKWFLAKQLVNYTIEYHSEVENIMAAQKKLGYNIPLQDNYAQLPIASVIGGDCDDIAFNSYHLTNKAFKDSNSSVIGTITSTISRFKVKDEEKIVMHDFLGHAIPGYFHPERNSILVSDMTSGILTESSKEIFEIPYNEEFSIEIDIPFLVCYFIPSTSIKSLSKADIGQMYVNTIDLASVMSQVETPEFPAYIRKMLHLFIEPFPIITKRVRFRILTTKRYIIGTDHDSFGFKRFIGYQFPNWGLTYQKDYEKNNATPGISKTAMIRDLDDGTLEVSLFAAVPEETIILTKKDAIDKDNANRIDKLVKSSVLSELFKDKSMVFALMNTVLSSYPPVTIANLFGNIIRKISQIKG